MIIRLTYTRAGQSFDVDVHVDTKSDKFENLVRRLAHRALDSKSRTASAAHGVIKVKVTGGVPQTG